MSVLPVRLRSANPRTLSVLLAIPVWIGGFGLGAERTWAQEAGRGAEAVPTGQVTSDSQPGLREAERMAETALAAGQADPEPEAEVAALPFHPKEIDLLELLLKGGWVMVPIAMVSLLVVAVAAERFIGLLRRKVLPARLIAALKEMANKPEGFDPRQAYQLCQKRRSAASKVIQAMLLKVGRPQSELEHAINQANEREAAELYSNVRWLNLAAAVAPLLGLLGTVWGMILAFFETVNLPVGANKAQCLADGIWQALVTTLAGLTVAIPAAILAHYFEGRIQRLIRELDEALFGLLPQLERYEGRLRLTKEQLEQPDAPPSPAAAASSDASKEAKRKKPAVSRK